MKHRILATVFLIVLSTNLIAQDYFIFTKEQMELGDVKFGPSPPYWTPTKEQAEAAINFLSVYIPQYVIKDGRQMLKKIDSYSLQIFGLYENGDEILFINAFCYYFENWKTQFVVGMEDKHGEDIAKQHATGNK